MLDEDDRESVRPGRVDTLNWHPLGWEPPDDGFEVGARSRAAGDDRPGRRGAVSR